MLNKNDSKVIMEFYKVMPNAVCEKRSQLN